MMLKDARMPAAGRERSAGFSLLHRIALSLAHAVQGFWRHGDLFLGAAISYYALFSLLPLTILLLVILQLIFPPELVIRNMGRMFGGLTDQDILLRVVKDAYTQQGSFGLFGAVTLILAAAGVFGAVQGALDRIWEVRGRIFHLRFLIGILTMVGTLLIFIGMLLATSVVFRLIRYSQLGVLLGWPKPPNLRASGALNFATALTQFIVFWTGYRFLPNAFVRWRDAWPGALVATVAWHVIAFVLSWYLARVADYATLYHQLQAIMALLVWIYGLISSFLFGAEFVVQWTAGSLDAQPRPAENPADPTSASTGNAREPGAPAPFKRGQP